MIKKIYLKRAAVILSFVAFNIIAVQAEIKLPAFFSDNMMLQQKSMVKIWGKANTGEKVVIKCSWDKKKYHTIADASGRWIQEIKTPAAEEGPFTIEITGKNKIVIKNVAVGEVWLCSGQSNMDMPVKGYWNSPITNAQDLLLNAPDKHIRLFRVAKKTSTSPQTDVEGKWEEADVSSVKEFSAVGYQFSLLLHKHLHVPVGMIQSTWGGSPIEAWMDTATLTQVSKEVKLGGGATTKAVHQTPANLFNGMINPLAGYGIAGVLWYQGEQNRYNANDYYYLQPAMVNAWRKLWATSNWPFFYVQIAPMKYPASQKALVPYFRDVQLKLLDVISNTGMAVSIDAGNEDNIHPEHKEIVSKRLAYLALAKTYNKTGIACSAPQYKSIAISNDTITITFSNAALGMTTNGKTLTQFEIAGKDKVFYKASAKLKGATIVAHSNFVQEPVAVRYAFNDWTDGELYSTEGLPVSPFRTDSW